jgi:hypothetical protein
MLRTHRAENATRYRDAPLRGFLPQLSAWMGSATNHWERPAPQSTRQSASALSTVAVEKRDDDVPAESEGTAAWITEGEGILRPRTLQPGSYPGSGAELGRVKRLIDGESAYGPRSCSKIVRHGPQGVKYWANSFAGKPSMQLRNVRELMLGNARRVCLKIERE